MQIQDQIHNCIFSHVLLTLNPLSSGILSDHFIQHFVGCSSSVKREKKSKFELEPSSQ